MTRRTFSAGLALLPAALGAAESMEARAKRVIEKCIDALGGDAFRQLPGQLQTGRAYRFYNEQISGLAPAKIYTKYLETPRGSKGKELRMVQRQVLGKKDDETVLLAADSGWDITYRGAEAISEDQIDRFRETTLTDTFYILRARLSEPDMSLVSRGAEVVENQPTEIVDYYDADNRNVRMWIHSTTFLPVRQLVKRWDPLIKDRREEITRYTKYNTAGNGVLWPHDVQRERDGEKTNQLFSDSVKVGSFEDSMFALPPNVKILKPPAPSALPGKK